MEKVSTIDVSGIDVVWSLYEKNEEMCKKACWLNCNGVIELRIETKLYNFTE